MSFLILNSTQFKHLYGERITAIARKLEQLYQKRVKLEQHIQFLNECKRYNLIPQGMNLKNVTSINKNQRILNNTMIKIRNNTLEFKYKQLRLNKVDTITQEKILQTYMMRNNQDRNHQQDLIWINKNDQCIKDKIIRNHKRKIDELIQKQQPKLKTKNMQKTSNIVNMSDIQLSNTQRQILEKGLKFVITPKSIDVIGTITNTEKSMSLAPSSMKQAAVSEISTFILKWNKRKQDNITKDQRQALKELKNMETIIIVPADKGGKTVIMNRKDYIQKIEDKLNDTNTYEVVKNPTKNVKKKISKLTNKLFQSNRINNTTKYELTSIDDLPTVRGQPKIHKQNSPMRIITCARNTITSPISKFAFSFIKQLRNTISNTISNTSKFLEEIKKIKTDPDERLASLDVEDLFNNIPIMRAVDIAIHRIGNSENFCSSSLTKTDLKRLLLISLNNSFFTFNGKFYRQKKGLPMGNTLSPILADLYMDEYMEKHMKAVNSPSKLYRYVDDILIITKMNENEIKDYIQQLNTIKSRIRFTSEYERSGKINFLDTTLSRKDNDNINIRWFRKDTASDRLLNYNSCHQKSIKDNIINNMTRRIIETTKNPIEQIEDLEKLKEMLLNSEFPQKEINKQIETTLKKLSNNSELEQKEEKEQMEYSICLPYVPGIEVLRRKLKKYKIKLYFSYQNKLQSLCTQTMKPESKSNIYQIPCECGAIYNGETKIGLKQRIKQHERKIKEDDENSNSELVQHFHRKKFQCMFNTEKAFIIGNEINWKKRRIKEAIYSTINNSINRHYEIDKQWTSVIHNVTPIIKNIINKKQQQIQ
jgi:hypothetical protein